MLAYRIYNQITDYSFRIRPLDIDYHDSKRGKTDEDRFGFLIEDLDDVAERNGQLMVTAGQAGKQRHFLHADEPQRDQRVGRALVEPVQNLKQYCVHGPHLRLVPIPRPGAGLMSSCAGAKRPAAEIRGRLWVMWLMRPGCRCPDRRRRSTRRR